ARVLGLAAVGAALLGVDTLATPANAQSACKNDRITAKSEIRVRGETFATNEAKQRWEREAEERFGRSFAKWGKAKDTSIECESAKSPTVGLPAKICTVSARPCENAQVTEEKEDDSRRGRRDGRRDDIVGRRDTRDGDRIRGRDDWGQDRLERERRRCEQL